MILPNFHIIAETEISTALKERGVHTFYDAIQWVHHLPYGRVKDPTSLDNVLKEGQGTCSTKHALLKALAEEHAIYDLKLSLAMYAMNDINTPGVGSVLQQYDLPCMFEAHVYLSYNDEIYDYTFPGSENMLWRKSVVIETAIDTDQIGGFKQEYHKAFLTDWIQRAPLDYTLDQLWTIREQCIKSLGTPLIPLAQSHLMT